MKNPTNILKVALLILALIVLAFLLILLPQVISNEFKGDFDYAPLLLALYIPSLPYFFALYQAFKVLKLIDASNVFSTEAVRAMKSIKYSAALFMTIFILITPCVFYLAQMDDAPGLVAFNFMIIFTSLVITTAAGVFQSLLQNAVDIKSENDLTV